jgi:hypothetical protein
MDQRILAAFKNFWGLLAFGVQGSMAVCIMPTGLDEVEWIMHIYRAYQAWLACIVIYFPLRASPHVINFTSINSSNLVSIFEVRIFHLKALLPLDCPNLIISLTRFILKLRCHVMPSLNLQVGTKAISTHSARNVTSMH